ncbi:hypothetical protein EMIT0P265_130051 [Pseudomonas zeae]
MNGGRTNANGLVSHLNVQGIGVCIAEDGDGAIAQGLGGALDAAGDFTAVGDQDFVDGGHGDLPEYLAVNVMASSRAGSLLHLECISPVGVSLLAMLLSGPPRFTLLHKSHGSLHTFGASHCFAKPLRRLIEQFT